ncbi:RNA-binding transcriptional accessory protein [Sedimentibacter hydroxybenzoicus DSM 7310]|uniref:RNA-binding transcriptional accessory protein n=1 Tax=Sedimentibacter hydroxybenzoicus DSM 7310 TaxID=1123245 RepID=A0A974GV00_SEDHY|nr:Tex family protein [Sedimentibacter hydroxybenzoicus]NYB72789.1 RNA-binding transcriptional accessory protein [Sedimentibacter hydroxybenzoicus DSM 7310]
MVDILKILCEEFNIKPFQVENTVNLIDEGNTIPFIARYRKEQTGSLDDVVLRDLYERLTYLRNLESRKEEVIRLIEEQGKLTDELKNEILSADVMQRVEDLYRPYKQKKSTRASKAKEKGLEPLADIILAQNITEGSLEELALPFVDEEKGVKNIKEAYEGACDIIAEMVSDNADYRKHIREIYIADGIITSEAADEEEKTVYEMYYKFEEAVNKIANHRILAINRGEKEKKLKVKLNTPDEKIVNYLKSKEIKNESAITADYYCAAIEDGYKRLIAPSIDREVRNILTERAEDEAIKVFGKNTKNLLMVPPVKDVRILAVDPGYRTGCKLAVLDGTGKFLEDAVIYPSEPRNEVEKSQKVMSALINKYDINVITIGNGTASRETEQVVADMLSKIDKDVTYTIVSEAGASVYSASKLAQEEYPDLDVTVRGAISIGRRLQDPLAELVKIDPKSIGVGQYQHDVNQTKLSQELDGVVEDCVNSVGVDLNTASTALLQYVSGITKTIAKNMVKYREDNGKFTNRNELMKVKMLGDKAFEQCAGFLRISDGDYLLDKTAVHPESYEIAVSLLNKLGYDINDLKNTNLNDINERIMKIKVKEEKKVQMSSGKNRLKGLEALSQINFKEEKKPAREKIKERIKVLAEELNIGVPTLTDIIEELKKPGRDPRDEMPKVILRSDVVKFEDMEVGMKLKGTVRNVVDFGAFVDIGVKQDGLVHLSEMSDRFIKNPMEVVQVGDVVDVTIIKLDKERQRIGLSMKTNGMKTKR